MKNKADMDLLKKRLKIFAVVLCVLMVRVWESVQAQRLDRQLKALRTETDRLTYENGRMQLLIHQYESPSNLDALAKKEFAMKPLDPQHRIGLQP